VYTCALPTGCSSLVLACRVYCVTPKSRVSLQQPNCRLAHAASSYWDGPQSVHLPPTEVCPMPILQRLAKIVLLCW
jgi:hypothetical protein